MAIGVCLRRNLAIASETLFRYEKTPRAVEDESRILARNLETRVANWYIREGINRNDPWRERMQFVFEWDGSKSCLPRFEAEFPLFERRLGLSSYFVPRRFLKRLN